MTVKNAAADRKQSKGYITVLLAVLIIVVAFSNIYKYAQNKQPGNAIWAGIALFAGSMILATQLARMRAEHV